MSDFESFLRTQDTGQSAEGDTDVIPVDREAEAAKEAELEKKERSNYEIISTLVSTAPSVDSLINILENTPLPLKDATGEEFNVPKAIRALAEIRDDLAFRMSINDADKSQKVQSRFIEDVPSGLGLKQRIIELYQ